MRPLRLILHNFLSYESLDLPLVNIGLALVYGENRDSDACSSNGSGKSAISDGLAWVIDGVTCRGVRGNDVVRRGSCAGCRGELYYQDGEQGCHIVRYQDDPENKNALEFWVDGNNRTLTDKTETQRLIHEHIGFDADSLRSILFMGQGSIPFTRRASAERKELVNQVLGVEEIRRAYKRATSKSQALDAAVRGLESQKAVLETRLSNSIGEARRWAERHVQWRQDQQASLDRKKLELQDLSIPKAVGTIGGFNKDYTALLDRLEAEISKLSDAYSEARSQSLVWQEKAQEQERLNLPAGGLICPTCRQIVQVEHIEAVRREVEQRTDEWYKISREWNETQSGYEAQLLIKRSGLRGLTEEYRTLQSLRDKEEADERFRQSTLTQLEKDIRALESAVSPFEDGIAQAKEQARQAQEQLFDIIKQLTVNQEERQYIAFWENAFSRTSPNNLEGRVLSIALPFLTDRTNFYLDKLFDGQVKIEFEIDATGKREKLDHRVINSQGALGYTGQSAGEAERVDIAVGLALIDLLFARVGKVFGFISIDEPVAYSDEAGGGRIVELIKSLEAKDRTILFTTHRRELLEAWDSRKLLVTKENGVSHCAVPGSSVENQANSREKS